MKNPKNLKYTKSDEWVKIEGKQATLGITDYAQGQLSDIVYVGFNYEKGQTIKVGESIATIESVKAAAEVSSPLLGIVLEVNQSLSTSPEVINDDPYGKGWMYKMDISSTTEKSDLMDAESYDKYCDSRGH